MFLLLFLESEHSYRNDTLNNGKKIYRLHSICLYLCLKSLFHFILTLKSNSIGYIHINVYIINVLHFGCVQCTTTFSLCFSFDLIFIPFTHSCSTIYFNISIYGQKMSVLFNHLIRFQNVNLTFDLVELNRTISLVIHFIFQSVKEINTIQT